jgi:uncharacterized membrane protein YdfJ with MMPL/SSD domain
MTDQTARTVANVVLTAAAATAAVIIVRTPALRRLAIGLTVSALTGAIPAWASRELQQAWTESGRRAL